jgi:hypothetical protein
MTLNQKYKKSKSDLPFKDWVFQQQKNGKLDFGDERFNIVDDKKESRIEIAGIPLTYIGIGVILVIGAFVIIPKLRK